VGDAVKKNTNKYRGVAIIETLLVMPVLLLLGMGIIHLGLVYQGKANLEYAALMAARVGSTTCINISRMREEVNFRMQASDLRGEPIGNATGSGGSSANGVSGVTIEVLNPDISVFDEYGGEAKPFSGCDQFGFSVTSEIPNDFLMQRPVEDDGASGISIQDANILRIKVTYEYDTHVPLMSAFYIDGNDEDDVASGVELVAYATVRMQSPPRITGDNQCCISGR
jgi:hypothetical protein